MYLFASIVCVCMCMMCVCMCVSASVGAYGTAVFHMHGGQKTIGGVGHSLPLWVLGLLRCPGLQGKHSHLPHQHDYQGFQ